MLPVRLPSTFGSGFDVDLKFPPTIFYITMLAIRLARSIVRRQRCLISEKEKLKPLYRRNICLSA